MRRVDSDLLRPVYGPSMNMEVPLRSLISEGRNLERWLDFRAHQIFDEAIIYTALQFYTKRPNETVKVAFAPDGIVADLRTASAGANDRSNAAPDHPEGNVAPNIGRPLTDASFVASSSMTSQCSARLPFSRRTISTPIQFAGRPMPVNRPWSST